MSEKYALPVWVKSGVEIPAIKAGVESIWDKAEGWLKTPLNQMDSLTCHPYVLGLIAYQRNVSRFKNENESTYRQRVEFAHKNLIDAGSQQGFKRIFERNNWPLLGQIERDPEKDWDVITLWLGDSTLAQDPELGHFIVRQYGRTCRRYEFLMVDGLETVTVAGQAASVERSVHEVLKQPDFIFEDETNSFKAVMKSTQVERSVHQTKTQEYVFSDQVNTAYLGFTSSSIERSQDMIKTA